MRRYCRGGGVVQGERLEDCEDEAWEGGEDCCHFDWKSIVLL